jgi:hypothetical protein
MSDSTADRVVAEDTHVAAAGLPHDLEIAETAEALGKVQELFQNGDRTLAFRGPVPVLK